jgi:hypothetical protein
VGSSVIATLFLLLFLLFLWLKLQLVLFVTERASRPFLDRLLILCPASLKRVVLTRDFQTLSEIGLVENLNF